MLLIEVILSLGLYFRDLKRLLYSTRLKRIIHRQDMKNHHDNRRNSFFSLKIPFAIWVMFIFNSQLFTTNRCSINEGNVGTQLVQTWSFCLCSFGQSQDVYFLCEPIKTHHVMMSVTMISKNSALRIFHLKKWETEDIFKNEKNLFLWQRFDGL